MQSDSSNNWPTNSFFMSQKISQQSVKMNGSTDNVDLATMTVQVIDSSTQPKLQSVNIVIK